MNWALVAAFTGPIVALLLAILGVLFHATVRWTKLDSTVQKIEEQALAAQKQGEQIQKRQDDVHLEMFRLINDLNGQMDRRVRWLEEHLWKDKDRGV